MSEEKGQGIGARLGRLLLQVVVLPVIGLLVAVAFLEVGIRAYLALRQPAPSWSDRPSFYYAHELMPSSQDFPHSPQKPENTFRIAVVGDSFTFAPYMQFIDAFPEKLEQMLNLNDTQMKGEVINYGVPAYSLSHEIEVVKRALAEDADLIILQVTLNDPELKPYRPVGIQTSLPDRFGAYIPQGKQASLVKYWKTAGLVLERLHNRAAQEAYVDYFLDLFENPKSWGVYEKSLKKIVRACRRHGDTPIVAFVFPLFGLPLDENYPFWGIHEKVAKLFEAEGVPSHDLQEIYRDIPLSRLQVIPNVDRHPNEIAHRMAAEEMYRWLEEHGRIPEELRIRTRYKDRTSIEPTPLGDTGE
ncbi:MAG: SGNH/GDSL hydrolase family protein [Bdellovibrionales bacterium]|nr:SGNH/GDSL hydrolase family protein [Bdellovibrionales bacterium]